MTFRIAVVQPICHRPGTDVANVADAARAIARAALSLHWSLFGEFG